MDKRLTLNQYEEQLLVEVLEYHLDSDDKELNDFKQQLENNGDTNLIVQLFPEKYGEVLQLRLVPELYRSHIYFKMESLNQLLRGVTHGG
jgi:hypothetical protein